MVANYQPGETICIGRPRAGMWLAGGGGFVGAYDNIPSIAAAYGMRRLRTAYTGNLLRLRRSSDNTEQDFGYVANGGLDTAAIATFVGGGSGFVVTWYDQSGNGRDATQTTAADQPTYVASVVNSRPAMQFIAGDWMSLTLTLSQPGQAIVVGRGNGSSDSFVDGTGSNRWAIHQNLSAGGSNQWGIFAGTALNVTEAGIGGAWHIHSGLFNGVSSVYRVDGVSKAAGNAGAQTITGLRLGRDSSGNTLVGYEAEVIVLAAALSAANENVIGSNQAAYFGLSWTVI